MNLSSSPAQNVGNSEIPNLNGILQPSNALSLSNTSLHLDLSPSSPTQEGPPSTWLANDKTEPNVQEHEESTELSSSTPPLVQSTLTGVHNLPANSAHYTPPTLDRPQWPCGPGCLNRTSPIIRYITRTYYGSK